MSSQSSLTDVSSAIRQEIIRFESVHPSIYAIYDFIDAIDDKALAESLRQLVVTIEDAFVNSQEWTLSNNVPDIKLGLLGSIQSGKSALVHRYLTGTYMHDESPEGGRFKKELSLDNQSHLLLIRDEGGPPDEQFSQWIDGVIFVFSLENFESYQLVYDYYARLCTYRSTSNLPMLLVGTQDSNCEPYVRVIDDTRARKLANDLKRCAYYETCAAYGLNVERVFQDACVKILQSRATIPSLVPRPITPQQRPCTSSPVDNSSLVAGINQSQQSLFSTVVCTRETPMLKNSATSSNAGSNPSVAVTTSCEKNGRIANSSNLPKSRPDVHSNPCYEPDFAEEAKAENNESLTPSSTPTHSRKNRRKSNLFQKRNEDERDRDKKLNGIGSGRAIPLKQGFLYKRTCKPLSKEWKTKKYVTLTDDARLTYHPSIHDYMDNTHGKEIDLSRTTVKIPGVAFRQVGSRITSNGLLRSQLNDGGMGTKDSFPVKKRHRRMKSNPKCTNADGSDSEGYEFQLVSVDRHWYFEATCPDDRDDWVMHIDRAIMTRLKSNESGKRGRLLSTNTTATGYLNNENTTNMSRLGISDDNQAAASVGRISDANEFAVTEHLIQNIKSAAGNDYCADCGLSDPDWASLNLGAMVCIGCSGIHRQLGTHISRIRSLHLDEWTKESVAVMSAIGNTLANSVWEAAVPINAGNRKKPDPRVTREEKESWIRAKYERQEFLPPLPYPDAPLQQQLIDAIARQDTRQVILCLALANPETVNAAYSRQDPRAAIHIAATLGNIVYLQLLLWYNGDPTITDHEGRNAFYYAHCSQKYDCAEFLLRNGCPKQLVPPTQPGNLLSTLRSSQQLIPQSSVLPSSSSSTASGSADMNNSSQLTQPHHFSHLQQHHHQVSTTASSGPSPPSLPTHLPGQLAAFHSTPNPSQPILSQMSGHAFIPNSNVNFPVTVNQALGATLPRRRGPICPTTGSALQGYPRPSIHQQTSTMSSTHRPNSSVVSASAVCRSLAPNPLFLRTPTIGSQSTGSTTRPISNPMNNQTNVISTTSVNNNNNNNNNNSSIKTTTVPNLTHPYSASHQEVGL